MWYLATLGSLQHHNKYTINFDKDIHGPQRMNLHDFGEPLASHLVPPADQSFSYPVKYLSIYWIGLHKIL